MSTIYYDSSGHRYHKSHNNQSNGYVREGDSSGHVYSDPTHWTSKSSSSSHHSGSSSSSSSNNNSNVKTIDAKTTTREYNNGKVVIKDRNTGKILYEGSSENVKEVPGKIIIGSNVNPGGWKDEHSDLAGNAYHYDKNGNIIVDSGKYKNYIFHTTPDTKPKPNEKILITQNESGKPEIDVFHLVPTQTNGNQQKQKFEDPQKIINQALEHPPITQPKQDVVNPSLFNDITPSIDTKLNYFKDTGKKNEKGEEIWTIDYEHPDVIQTVDTIWTENPVAKNIEKSRKSREERLAEYNQKPGRKAVIEAENSIIEGGETIGEFVAGHPGKIAGGAIGYAIAGAGELTTGAIQAGLSDRYDEYENLITGGKAKKKVGDDVFNYLDTQVYNMEQIAGRPAEILLGDNIKDSDLEMIGAFVLPGAAGKGGKFVKTGKLDIGPHTLDVGLKNGYIALETVKSDKYSRKQINWGDEKRATGERWYIEKYEIIPNGEKYVRDSNIELYEWEQKNTQKNKYLNIDLNKPSNKAMPIIDADTPLEFVDSGKRGGKSKKVKNVNKQHNEIVEYADVNLDSDAISYRETNFLHQTPHIFQYGEKKSTFDLKTKKGRKSEQFINYNEGWIYNYKKTPELESMNLHILDSKVKSYGQEEYAKQLSDFLAAHNKKPSDADFTAIPTPEKYTNEDINIDFIYGKPKTQRQTYMNVDDMNIPEMTETSIVILNEDGEFAYSKTKGPKGINWKVRRDKFTNLNLEVESKRVLEIEELEKPEKIPTFPFERVNPGKPMKPWNILDDEEVKPLEKPTKSDKSAKSGKSAKSTTITSTELTKQLRLEKLDMDSILDTKVAGIEKDVADTRRRVGQRKRDTTIFGYGLNDVLGTETTNIMKIEPNTANKAKRRSKNTRGQRQKQVLQPDYDILDLQDEQLMLDERLQPDVPKPEPRSRPEPLSFPDILPILSTPKIKKKTKGKAGSSGNIYVGKRGKRVKKGRKNEKNVNLLDLML